MRTLGKETEFFKLLIFILNNISTNIYSVFNSNSYIPRHKQEK